ncbi:MAG: hypothetical protein ACOY3Z_10790 [Thermodesulfobacteriota bacterium]
MLKQDLIAKNPIRHLKSEGGTQDAGRMGLVMARAGVGKTALLVQIALDSLLNDKEVVHVSVGQTIEKAKLWYEDMFKDIAESCNLSNATEVHDEIMRHRMIITFNESKFSRAKLQERLSDLIQQNVIRPSCMVVDGFDFAKTDRSVLEEVKAMARAMGLQVWFSSLCEDDGESCHAMDDLFDTVVVLQPAPEKSCLDLKVVKGATAMSKCGKLLKLDPITFMVKESCE